MPSPSRSTAAEWFSRPTASSVSTIWRDPEQVNSQSPSLIKGRGVTKLPYPGGLSTCLHPAEPGCGMSYRAQSGTSAPTVQTQLAPELAWPTPPNIQLRAWGFVVSRISGLELMVSELGVSSQLISFCLECLAPKSMCCDCCEPVRTCTCHIMHMSYASKQPFTELRIRCGSFRPQPRS